MNRAPLKYVAVRCSFLLKMFHLMWTQAWRKRPHFLTDQLTLSQPGWHIIPTQYYVPSRIFRPCDGPDICFKKTNDSLIITKRFFEQSPKSLAQHAARQHQRPFLRGYTNVDITEKTSVTKCWQLERST